MGGRPSTIFHWLGGTLSQSTVPQIHYASHANVMAFLYLKNKNCCPDWISKGSTRPCLFLSSVTSFDSTKDRAGMENLKPVLIELMKYFQASDMEYQRRISLSGRAPSTTMMEIAWSGIKIPVSKWIAIDNAQSLPRWLDYSFLSAHSSLLSCFTTFPDSLLSSNG
jgi:hypothetical protein